MTCGLTQVGSPAVDEEQELGLHGRYHHLPGRQIVAEGNWDGDEYEMRIRGVVEEASIFGTKLRLTREIHSRLGENRIQIHDIVENIGFKSCPHMILYHFNFGFPLMSERTETVFPSSKITTREDGYDLEEYCDWQAPVVGYHERVYYHEKLTIDSNGFSSVLIRNPEFPLSMNGQTGMLQVKLSWDQRSLPELVQWKMPGAGEHVMGIEPANCRVEGRVSERKRGKLELLQPGEQKHYKLELVVSVK